jgi:hypothetical protein
LCSRVFFGVKFPLPVLHELATFPQVAITQKFKNSRRGESDLGFIAGRKRLFVDESKKTIKERETFNPFNFGWHGRGKTGLKFSSDRHRLRDHFQHLFDESRPFISSVAFSLL